MYSGRNFMIFSVDELPKVDFSKVLETSAETVRKSVDGTKTFVKWDSEIEPEFVANLQTKEGTYTYEQILEILSSSEWSSPILTGMTYSQNIETTT